jgi:hypothetical protein
MTNQNEVYNMHHKRVMLRLAIDNEQKNLNLNLNGKNTDGIEFYLKKGINLPLFSYLNDFRISEIAVRFCFAIIIVAKVID